MGVFAGPEIAESGLVLALDAGNIKSYNAGISTTTWTDLSGRGNTGTLTNGPTYSSGSIVFDGTNDYVVIPRPVQDDFTLSCWFKTNQTASPGGGVDRYWYDGYGLIDGATDGTSGFDDFGMTVRIGKLCFGVGNPDTSFTSPLSYNDNIWHYAVATRIRSSGAIALYVDGVLVISGTAAGTQSLTSPLQLRIGCLQTGVKFFLGNLAQVSIYNRALSAAEIQQNFNALRGRFSV
jgi:hypothetical protein